MYDESSTPVNEQFFPLASILKKSRIVHSMHFFGLIFFHRNLYKCYNSKPEIGF